MVPRKPAQIFVTGRMDERQPVSSFATRLKGRHILLSYTSLPFSPAALLRSALNRDHHLLTVGADMTPAIINAWNLNNLKETPKPHDIEVNEMSVNIDCLMDRMPEDFEPDFFLWVETGIGRAPEQLEKLAVPKAAWFILSHRYLEHHLESAKAFDVVFVAQHAFIPEFKNHGNQSVFWLPLACDPDMHGNVFAPKQYDVGFVGSLEDERRASLLKKLSSEMNVSRKQVFLSEMAEHYSRSRIVFNSVVRNGLNMRVFEGLCSGSMLLTDPGTGMDELFEHKKHLVIYEDDEILELARYYLSHESEREKIAQNGRREVLERHTFRHRANEILRIMTAL